jgi:nucleotide-binding universal stress UspA family protein
MATHPTTPISVLCAIDFSETSSLVLQHAVATARQVRAEEIHFLHVRTSARSEDDLDGPRAELENWLSARIHGVDGVPDTVKVVAHEATGNPADVIVEMASDLLASVVVVGTHGRKGMQRMVMGSVAEAVVRNAGCPVLVVRPLMHEQPVPRIEPPCPRCVETRVESGGKQLWCAQHSEKHGRRHTYYNTRHETWVNQRITL